jgi:cbb3-type cytochrome oxidase subunit 3
MGAAEFLILLVLVGLVIVPTFYGLWRAARTEEWGWFVGIALGWLVFGLGWIVGLVFLLGPDRKARAS